MPVGGVPPLLHRIVDSTVLMDAGPRREMAEVVDAHVAARTGEAGGIVGSLVVPVSRLQELVGELAKRRPPTPLPIALLVDTGLGGVPKALSLTTSRAALISPLTVEMPAPHDVDSVWLERVTEFVPEDVVAVVEPRRPDVDGSVEWLDGVQRVVDHGCRPKLRCGGGRAGAFPGVTDVASFLALAAEADRSFTASIALHHAVRRVDPESGFLHHGWLNLLVAAARAVAIGARASTDWAGTEAALADALHVTDPEVLVAELREVDEAFASRIRSVFSSFGSSSLTRPGEEMAALGLL